MTFEGFISTHRKEVNLINMFLVLKRVYLLENKVLEEESKRGSDCQGLNG